VSFATDIIDIGVCPGFWKTRKMEKCILPVCSLSSLHTSATQHCRKTHKALMMIPSQIAFQVKLF